MEDVEEPEESSGCGGAIVVMVMAALPLGVLYMVSPDAFVLALWMVGWGSIIWAAKHVPCTPNPAPPAPPERGSDEKPQVTVIRDQSHPNRWLVTRPSRWMTADTDKTGTS